MANVSQKIVFSVIIVAILIMVGFSVFKQYVPAQVSQVVQEVPVSVEQAPVVESTKGHFKIMKYEGVRATNIVWGTVKNINNAESSATINVKLHYAGKVVAEKSITLENLKIYEERRFEVVFDNPSYWNAVSVDLV